MGVNPWVVHRDRSVFGEDVEIFRPERWLVDDAGDMSMWPRAAKIFPFMDADALQNGFSLRSAVALEFVLGKVCLV